MKTLAEHITGHVCCNMARSWLARFHDALPSGLECHDQCEQSRQQHLSAVIRALGRPIPVQASPSVRLCKIEAARETDDCAFLLPVADHVQYDVRSGPKFREQGQGMTDEPSGGKLACGWASDFVCYAQNMRAASSKPMTLSFCSLSV